MPNNLIILLCIKVYNAQFPGLLALLFPGQPEGCLLLCQLSGLVCWSCGQLCRVACSQGRVGLVDKVWEGMVNRI